MIAPYARRVHRALANRVASPYENRTIRQVLRQQ